MTSWKIRLLIVLSLTFCSLFSIYYIYSHTIGTINERIFLTVYLFVTEIIIIWIVIEAIKKAYKYIRYG